MYVHVYCLVGTESFFKVLQASYVHVHTNARVFMTYNHVESFLDMG